MPASMLGDLRPSSQVFVHTQNISWIHICWWSFLSISLAVKFHTIWHLAPLNCSPVWGNCDKTLSHKLKNHAAQVLSSSSMMLLSIPCFTNSAGKTCNLKVRFRKPCSGFLMSLKGLVPKYPKCTKFASWIELNYAQRDSVDKLVVPKKEYLQGIL